MIRRLLLAAGCLALLLWSSTPAAAQQSRTLDVGTMRYSTNETLTEDDLGWPRAQPHTEQSLLETYGIIIGVPRTWTDASGVTRDIQIAQVAQNKFSDVEAVTPPVQGAFKRIYRNPYPSKVIDGTDRTPIVAQGDPVDPGIPADAMIYAHMNTWTGIDIERWAYAFANDAHDDYIILEHVFTNSSSETLQDVYFGITAETNANSYYPADLWGTYYGATYSEYVAGDPAGDSLRVWISWDADETGESPEIDDRGNPNSLWANFQEPQFMAHAVLHADASATDESDAPGQPWKAGWSQRELAPDLNVAGHEDIYAYLSQGWDAANPGAYAMTVDASGNQVPSGPYRVLRDGLEINNTTQYDPVTEQEKTALFSFGPYTLAPGQNVRIVTAMTGGQVPHRWAIDAGRAYDNGFSQQLPLVPLPYDIVNPFTGELIAAQGSTLDKQTKNEILDLGFTYALANASLAERTWDRSDVAAGQGTFDVPLAPAAPSLQAFSENDRTRLTWGQEAEQDPRAGAVESYRIYREYVRPVDTDLPTDTTFVLLDEVPVGTYEYVDTDVIRGEDYYYYVTAVTEDGIESSPYLNRTGTSSPKVQEAISPTRAPDPGWEENVVVVPNPYHVQGASNYEEDKRLNFLNLPAYANIHIYTMTGDLVQTIEHDASTGDVDWERQDTFSTMEIVSGIYLYVVEELDGPRGSATGRQAIGKFVVIK